MADISFDVAEGYYLNPFTARMVLSGNVQNLQYTVNGALPSISKYVAYDQLTPPNPFIAVTQDGNGNVVYDGGFPKFYNPSGPAAGLTSRDQLSASFKYLYNAILWTANAAKYAAGNRKILIMGDVSAGVNYAVKSTGGTGFFTSFSRLCAVAGFTPTFVDVDDYPGSKLDTTLATMEQHACVLLMSSGGGLVDNITNACVDALVQYRQGGSGIIIVTDDGPVFTDISQAYPAPPVSRQFFTTANKVAVNFGTYFSGNYDRTPVNVGFLRSTYGDHPLYAGMLDTESISAGGSESRVMVQQYATYLPGQVQPFSIPLGKTVIQAAVRRLDQSVIAFKITYNVGPFDIGLSHGASTKKNGETLDVRSSNRSEVAAVFATATDAVVAADILKNGVKVGALTYTKAGGVSQTWLTGKTTPVAVQNGDVFTVAVKSPIVHNVAVTIKRFQPAIKGVTNLATVLTLLRAYDPTKTDIDVVELLITEIAAMAPALQLKHQQNIPLNLKVLGEFFNNEGTVSVVP